MVLRAAGVRLPQATYPVLGFEHRADAERLLAEWKDRVQKFELELHPGQDA
jgi:hypothetical protein